MATRLCEKRMAKERKELEAETANYFASFHDDDLLNFEAYVIGPDDTPYENKLIKLHFELPSQYPMVPPKVKFIQHSGERIHPNLYVEGKVCLSILGTWNGPGWAYGMTCNTVLITIRSLLDSEPYKHEPNQPNNPDFNKYVQYATWKCLLLDYVERADDEKVREWLQDHIYHRRERIIGAITSQQSANASLSTFRSPYNRGQGTLQMSKPDYPSMITRLEAMIASSSAAVTERCTREETKRAQQIQKQDTDALLSEKSVGDNKRTLNNIVDLTSDADGDQSSQQVTKQVKPVEVIDLT